MFRRSKDANKAAPQITPPPPPPQPQFPTGDDRLVAEAIVFLLDGGQEDAAEILLTSRVNLEPVQTRYTFKYDWSTSYQTASAPVLRVHLTSPRLAFDAMNRTSSKEPRDLAHAFRIVWESSRSPLAAKDAQKNGVHPVEFDITYGRTDPAHQAKMTQLVKSMTANYRQVEGIQVVQQGEPITLRPIPVFPTGPFERDDNLCFVIMPFAAQFHAVYADGIKPGVISAGLRCQRGDDIMQPGDILSQIWGGLMAARFLVADVTGANGNVLYELGLAHVVGHQAILLTQNMNDVPFDLRQQRHIVYTPAPEGLQKLQADLRTALQQLVAANARA